MKKIGALMLMGSMIVLMSGCLKDGSTNQVPVAQTSVSFYDADPDGNTLGIIMNGTQINSVAFQYKTYTGYATIEPGVKTLKFTSVSTTNSLHDTTYTLAAFKAYSVFVSKRPNTATLTSVLTDNSGVISTTGNTLIRFANMSPDSPALDIKIVGQETKPIAVGLRYLQVGNYVEFASSDDTVEIRRSSDGHLVQSIALTSLTGGTFQTIILSGYNVPPPGNLNSLSIKVVR